jgi:hypothetical protein
MQQTQLGESWPVTPQLQSNQGSFVALLVGYCASPTPKGSHLIQAISTSYKHILITI